MTHNNSLQAIVPDGPAPDLKRYTEPKEARACPLDWSRPEFGTLPI